MHKLLLLAPSLSVDELRAKAQELTLSGNSADERRKKLRNEQYIKTWETSRGTLKGQFELLNENATFLPAWEKFRQKANAVNDKSSDPLPVHAAEAEAFARFIARGAVDGGSSKPRAELSYHFDVNAKTATLAGVGSVPASVIEELNDPLIRLIFKHKNKLIWYSEPNYNNKALPESIKRAVKAATKGVCQTSGCVRPACDVDHRKARVNGGTHDLSNLQALCESCHDAKTKTDAPWTIGKYFRAPPLADTS